MEKGSGPLQWAGEACGDPAAAGPRASESLPQAGELRARGTGGRVPTKAFLGHINSPSVGTPPAPHILLP